MELGRLYLTWHLITYNIKHYNFRSVCVVSPTCSSEFRHVLVDISIAVRWRSEVCFIYYHRYHYVI